MDCTTVIFDEIQTAITVCDKNGIIVYMNEKSKETFGKYGGESLLGKSLLDCHTPESQVKIKDLLANQRSNTYIIIKKGVKKLIHQTPWIEKRTFAGLIEFSIVLPDEIPIFDRG